MRGAGEEATRRERVLRQPGCPVVPRPADTTQDPRSQRPIAPILTVAKKHKHKQDAPTPSAEPQTPAASTPTSAADASATSAAPPTAVDTSSVPVSGSPQEAKASHFAFRALRAAKWLLTEYDLLGGTPPKKGEESAAPPSPETEATAAQDAADHPTLVGHSSVLAVPEVLGLLATLQKSGRVEVWNDEVAYRIQMVRGAVASAQTTSNDPELRLGSILVEDGVVTKDVLDDFVQNRLPRGKRLGDALVEAALVDRDAIARAIEHQAQKVFHAAYDLPNSWYRFDPVPEATEPERGMSMTQLLLESARRRDEVTKAPQG